MRVKVLENKKVVTNPWFTVYQDKIIYSNSQIADYSYLSKRPTVFIIARDKTKRIYLINEFRYPIKKRIWQLPAGMLEGDGNKLSAAKRELMEETGLESHQWCYIGRFYVAPGHENTEILVYFADNVLEVKDGSAKERDIVRVKAFSQEALEKMIEKNQIKCGLTLAALILFISRHK